jgi:hypothetical protein
MEWKNFSSNITNFVAADGYPRPNNQPPRGRPLLFAGPLAIVTVARAVAKTDRAACRREF